jgi:DNA-binding protein Fis
MPSSVFSIELAQFRPERGDIMCEEREKVRCRSCELVQWGGRANCRRCGKTLPEPLVKVVEKVVIRYAPECLQSLEEARRLISEAEDRLTKQLANSLGSTVLAQTAEAGKFPTLAEVERAMIVTAYQLSNRKTLKAAHLLGIRKTTLCRKLKSFDIA